MIRQRPPPQQHQRQRGLREMQEALPAPAEAIERDCKKRDRALCSKHKPAALLALLATVTAALLVAAEASTAAAIFSAAEAATPAGVSNKHRRSHPLASDSVAAAAAAAAATRAAASARPSLAFALPPGPAGLGTSTRSSPFSNNNNNANPPGGRRLTEGGSCYISPASSVGKRRCVGRTCGGGGGIALGWAVGARRRPQEHHQRHAAFSPRGVAGHAPPGFCPGGFSPAGSSSRSGRGRGRASALPVTAGGSPNLNGTEEASSPARSATAEDGGGEKSGWQKQQQQAELTVSALLKAIAPDLSSPARGTGGRNPFRTGAASADGGEEGECEDLDGWQGHEVPPPASPSVSDVVAVDAPPETEAVEAASEEGGDGGGDTGGAAEDEDEEGGEGGSDQERGRKRDMYKIRSLLLQGQIAGLRERLKERELDVKELRVLTGGRGQSKLRELGAMLKEARGECDALQAREKSLREELAMSQKEGDILRGDLLANQKALSDLNAYADSLRSRYTAEMVKLEASLAEMERELTRAEAAHMRERRELLDREAAAVADQELFRSRTILLQGEVVKTRARETDLRRENARLAETSSALEAERASISSGKSPGEPQQRQLRRTNGDADSSSSSAEVRSLEADNAALRLKLEALSAGDGSSGDASLVSLSPPPFYPPGRGGSGAESGLTVLDKRGARGDSKVEGGGVGGGRSFLPWGSRRETQEGDGIAVAVAPAASSSLPGPDGGGAAGGVVVVDAVVNDSNNRSGDEEGATSTVAKGGDEAPRDGSGSAATATATAPAGAGDSTPNPESSISDGNGMATQTPPAAGATTSGTPGGPSAEVNGSPAAEDVKSDLAVAKAAGFKGKEDAERAFREAGVNRVVEGLRAENTRLRQRLRAAEHAAEEEEYRANAEADRADAVEAELGRVRATVKGRVKALKAALEEAEEDADRAIAEKEEFVLQWEEDVDALRRQLGAERQARDDDRRELEGAIFDLEDEIDELKERYGQRRNAVAVKRKQRNFIPGEADQHDDVGSGAAGGGGMGEAAGRRRSETEAAKRSEERSKKRADAKKADEEWKKAMTLFQYLD